MKAKSPEQPKSSTRIPRPDGTVVFFCALAVMAGATVWYRQGEDVFLTALGSGMQLLLWITPVILGAVLISAYVQAMIPSRVMQRWLGRDSGLRGLLLATAAGALTPGGPFAAFPLILGLYRAGAAFPLCVTYLTAWSVLGLNRVLIWELPLLGADFVLLRLAVSLPLPLLAGLLATVLCRCLERPA